jgi:hypothetical protein
VSTDNPKAEFHFPNVLGEGMTQWTHRSKVLINNDTWSGVSYKADQEAVQSRLQELTDAGIYPTPLINHLLNCSNSRSESSLGLTITHHFPHHNGIHTTEHFKLIHADNDITSSLLTSWWNLIHHLYGHLMLLCWDLNQVKVCVFPSSITTGIETSCTWSGYNIYSISHTSYSSERNAYATFIWSCIDWYKDIER